MAEVTENGGEAAVSGGESANPVDMAIPTRIKNQVAANRRWKRQMMEDWRISIEYRRGKPFATDSDQDRIAVAIDWAYTKSKIGQMFSTVPEPRLTPKKRSPYAPVVPVFAEKLVDELKVSGVDSAFFEALPDIINAAGIGAVHISFEAKYDTVEVPLIDTSDFTPEMLQEAEAQQLIPKETIDRIIARRFLIKRISPFDLLWPVNFKQSDFNMSPWIGRRGSMTWEEVPASWGLKDEEKQSILAAGKDRHEEQVDPDEENRVDESDPKVFFDEIFYWDHVFNKDAKSFKKIMHLVFVDGRDTPVIHEPWKGQKYNEETSEYVGSCKFPIQVGTLAYISDEAIPPSDSAIGRPQVDELIRSRSQMYAQRKFAFPMRWFNSDHIGPEFWDALMKGEIQGAIPVQGDGSKYLGQMERASWPNENFTFDGVVKGDLQEAWKIGPNIIGQAAAGSASEANILQENFQTQVGQERQRIAKMFTDTVEVFAGLYALYGDFENDISEEVRNTIAGWDRSRIAVDSIIDIRPDSTVLLDSNQRKAKLMETLNLVGKSGYVDVEPIIREIVELSGLDPDKIVKRPGQEQPEPVKISLTGKAEDLVNPMFMATLLKNNQAPSPEELQAAIKLIQSAAIGMAQPTMPPQPEDEKALEKQAQGVGGPGDVGKEPMPGSDNPDWDMMDKVNKRREDGE